MKIRGDSDASVTEQDLRKLGDSLPENTLFFGLVRFSKSAVVKDGTVQVELISNSAFNDVVPMGERLNVIKAMRVELEILEAEIRKELA